MINIFYLKWWTLSFRNRRSRRIGTRRFWSWRVAENQTRNFPFGGSFKTRWSFWKNCKSSCTNDNYLCRIIQKIYFQRGRFFNFFVRFFTRVWRNIVLIILILETIFIILKAIFCFQLDFDRNTSSRALHKFITIFLFYQETSHLVSKNIFLFTHQILITSWIRKCLINNTN